MSTYLYIKTHNITGLKYFGKTKKDPYKYPGSGLKWGRHLNKHGSDVTTEVIGLFDNEELLVETAIRFSIENNIVESKEWANMKIENGLDGGFKHDDELHQKYKDAWIERRKRPISDETRAKLSAARRGKPSGAKGKTRSEEAKRKAVETRLKNKGTLKHTEETKEKMRKPKSEGHGEKVSAYQKGKPKSEEQRKKISESVKKHYESKSSLSSR